MADHDGPEHQTIGPLDFRKIDMQRPGFNTEEIVGAPHVEFRPRTISEIDNSQINCTSTAMS